MTIRLKHTGTYKDGGSKSYVDEKGNKYWLCGKIRSPNKGKLYKGDINDPNPKLAYGYFELDSTRFKEKPKSKIIKQ